MIAAGVASSTWLASRAFVGAPSASQTPALRGASSASVVETTTNVDAASSSLGATSCGAVLVGASALAAAASKTSRTARRVEPVSAAAAAVAATKAAGAAKAATQTGAAVAGAAAAGGLTKGGREGVAGTATPSPSFNPALQIGATAPLGYFDPAGFCKVGDENGFRTLRAAEIKHGRVAMMAALGATVQHYLKLPGFDKVPAGLAAVTEAPGSYGMIVLFLIAGALELGPWSENANREPGNFGDPAGLAQYTDDMRNRELNNGRAAMFAAVGIIAAEIFTGKDGIEQLGF